MTDFSSKKVIDTFMRRFSPIPKKCIPKTPQEIRKIIARLAIPRTSINESDEQAIKRARSFTKHWILSDHEKSGILGVDRDMNRSFERNPLKLLISNYDLNRHISYSVSDNVLIIDLYNPLMLEVLLGETKNQFILELKECIWKNR